MIKRNRFFNVLLPLTFAASLPLLLGAARATTWKDWWLPDDYSEHGPQIDWLFKVIFWITMGIFVVVELLLVYFAIKYRFRPERRKGIFSHGNTRLEMAWTIVPAIVLLWISLATKKVWDEYRFGTAADAGNRTQIMVIGQQFKWNVIYAGPDGKLGKYLSYPKPSDPEFAHRPAADAVKDVAKALLENPLGQRINPDDKNDPGVDDDTVPQPGRPLIVPMGRPLEITLGSRDVLHSFFLPNFRVKLDAVPGLRGKVYFKAMKQSTKSAAVALVPEDKLIWLDSSTPKAFVFSTPATYQIYDPKVIAPEAADPYAVDPNTLDPSDISSLVGARSRDEKKRKEPWLRSLQSTLRDGAIARLRDRAIMADQGDAFDPMTIPPATVAEEVIALKQDLKKMGITALAYVDEKFEIVCEELCGNGHSQMNGDLIVVSPDQFDRFINKKPPGSVPAPEPAPTTAPASQPTTAPAP